MKHEKIYIYGKHAILEALTHAPRAISRAFIDPGVKEKELRAELAKNNIPVAPLGKKEVVNVVGKHASHQGMIALLRPSLLFTPFETFLETLHVTPNTALVYLDHVQDPHNVGAIIRSAAAFGAAAVLMPRQKQALLTGAVVKASAGMVFRVPLVELPEPDKELSALHKKGFTIFGLAGEGSTLLGSQTFQSPAVFFFGNEGEGLSGRGRAHCDTLLSIPMHPRCESLNVAAAAAATLFAWSSQHKAALTQKAS